MTLKKKKYTPAISADNPKSHNPIGLQEQCMYCSQGSGWCVLGSTSRNEMKTELPTTLANSTRIKEMAFSLWLNHIVQCWLYNVIAVLPRVFACVIQPHLKFVHPCLCFRCLGCLHPLFALLVVSHCLAPLVFDSSVAFSDPAPWQIPNH